MKYARLVDALLKAAALSHHTEFVVIGSSAAHGTVENPPVDAAIQTPMRISIRRHRSRISFGKS